MLFFYKKRLFKANVDFTPLLIGAECARLLRDYGAGETPQALSAEETPRNAREPHAHGAEINRQV